MRVRIVGHLSGTRNGEDWPPPGGEVDLPDDEALAYLNAGIVEAASEAPDVETSTPETKPRKRTGGLTKGNTGL